ncbi:MAG: hypothetical protein QM771_13900, partial [Nitrospira sp.]
MGELVSLMTGRIRSSADELAVSIVVYGIVALFALTAYAALLYARCCSDSSCSPISLSNTLNEGQHR